MRDTSLTSLIDLNSSVAIVTGASRGIGVGIARVFHRAGARTALVARSEAPLRQLAGDLNSDGDPPEAIAIPGDVAIGEDVQRIVEQTVETFGRVDILVNNAGLLSPGRYTDIDAAEWDRLIAANLTGAYLLCREAATRMEPQRRGRIINISSISAQTGGVSGGVHYAASKAGMLGMTKTLSRDLAPFGITVNAITPGVIDTNPDGMPEETRKKVEDLVPLGRVGVPEDIAHAALFLASEMGAYITGATIDVNGGILKR
jgi:NAD(P)-dependent dehydrogenase (short-subunit alcohol dehydrogenase family)